MHGHRTCFCLLLMILPITLKLCGQTVNRNSIRQPWIGMKSNEVQATWPLPMYRSIAGSIRHSIV